MITDEGAKAPDPVREASQRRLIRENERIFADLINKILTEDIVPESGDETNVHICENNKCDIAIPVEWDCSKLLANFILFTFIAMSGVTFALLLIILENL